MTTVTIALPEELLAALHRSPDEIEVEVRLAAAVEWYRRGLISQGRGAEIAGLARADFIDALAERRVDVAQLDPSELPREAGQ
jgi:predicted HTH domain antitoxin